MTIFNHIPVMVEEVVRFLRCESQGCYVDATVGGGGHAAAILEASKPAGRLFGVDRDKYAVQAAGKNLKLFENRFSLVQGKFSDLPELITKSEFKCADGILLDLGVSSYQLDEAGRGFGFMKEGPLDMRMDIERGKSAADIMRDKSEEELADIIFEFGEERYARKIARVIVEQRNKKPILKTSDLAGVVISALPHHSRHGRIHPATRTFQALRIYVNDEMGELKKFLECAPELLCQHGRLAVISYHSLEDRLVKNAFRSLKEKGGYKIVTKKVVRPLANEVQTNPRSRSAKLRVLERD